MHRLFEDLADFLARLGPDRLDGRLLEALMTYVALLEQLCTTDFGSVIGYDDVPFARYSRPALSTISQDTAKAGRLMVSKLLDASGQGASRSERVPTDLIIRESCGG